MYLGSLLVVTSVGNTHGHTGGNRRSNYVMSAGYKISVINNMSYKRSTGSLNLTVLLEQAKKGHSAYKRGKNGHIYVAITQFEGEEKDKYGNNFSILLNSKKDNREAEGKIYVGNLAYPEPFEEKPLEENAPDIQLPDDLPF